MTDDFCLKATESALEHSKNHNINDSSPLTEMFYSGGKLICLNSRPFLRNAILRQSLPSPTRCCCAPSSRARGFSRLSRSTPTADILSALKNDGYVVVQSMFTKSQIDRLNVDIDKALASISAGKSANVNDEPLPANLGGYVFGSNTKRLGSLLNISPTWRKEIIDDNVLHQVSEASLKELGGYWLSTAQLIEIGPGSNATPLHADGSGWWPFWSMGDKWNPEYALNFLIAVTDTTKANGATGVVKGSHKFKYSEATSDPTFKLFEFPDDQVEQIELTAGDCLILGSKAVHRGGRNSTADEYRRILSCTVVSSSLTPEEAHPLTIDKDMAKQFSERVKSFTGFRSQKTTLGPNVWQSHKSDLSKTLGF